MPRLRKSLAALLAVAPAAFASDWQLAGTTPAGHRVFVDAGSLRPAKTTLSAELRVEYPKPIESGTELAASARLRVQFRCERGETSVDDFLLYRDLASTGLLRRQKAARPRFEPDAPGTITDVARRFACGLR